MQSAFLDEEARAYVDRYAASGVGEALALRVYTSRLIGREADLVLHGGGNTSVKATARDLFGRTVDVLHIKGSGWDLADIEPAGLPAVEMSQLLPLRGLDKLDDAVMVACLRKALLDASAPNPSVETLLHAFLPHRFIDHSHADAILAITNQPDGEARCAEIYGDRIAWVPYVMPGLELAKRSAEIYEKFPEVEGLVLEKHGLFTFGDDAKTSYERHVSLVQAAMQYIEANTEGRRPLDARPVVATREPHEIAPIVRGALAAISDDPDARFARVVLEHRSSDEILHFAAAGELAAMLSAAPPITPDHVIRTKGPYLFVERPAYSDPELLAQQLRAEVEQYRQDYRAYFERNARGRDDLTMLEPSPRVAVLPGVGIFAAGASVGAARVAADIAEHSIRTKIWAQTIGHYVGIEDSELFSMEYWSLEQAKLGKQAPPPLAGQVALVTGGAGAIGEGVARCLLEAGAAVVLTDLDADRLEAAASRLDHAACVAIAGDITDEVAVDEVFAGACAAFGGVDLVVANAGLAATGRLETLDVEDFERTVDVNLKGTFLTLRAALRLMRIQQTGGNVVLLSTKNVFAPGAEFGAYSASKAGGHQLGKIAALEAAPIGVRVNMINADAIFGDATNRSGLWETVGPGRAQARGIAPEELEEFYRNRNLLKARITARHVGRAVLFFATQQTPTTGAALPVDGGLPEAFPR